MSASVVPGRPSSANRIGSSTSRRICTRLAGASSSRVAGTAPSTEFSNGTSAASPAAAHRIERGDDARRGFDLGAYRLGQRAQRGLGEGAGRAEVGEGSGTAAVLGRGVGIATVPILEPG